MAKKKKKVKGPVVDAEFVRKSTDSQSEEMAVGQKGENEMTDVKKEEVKDTATATKVSNEEMLKMMMQQMQLMQEQMKEMQMEMEIKETQAEEKKGLLGKIGDGIGGFVRKHPVLTAVGACALGAGGVYAGYQMFSDDDEPVEVVESIETGTF